MKKILLLDASYQPISFITERRMIKLVFKPNKVDIINVWENEYIYWYSGKIKYPSILRLKDHVKISYSNNNFTRRALVKRDNSHCMYCNKKLSPSQVTIDHVLPKSQGGATSFSNCVVACHFCNNKKANRTPEQASMVLLKKPIHPSFSNNFLNEPQDHWNDDWNSFLNYH
jgi:hypothetical protein